MPLPIPRELPVTRACFPFTDICASSSTWFDDLSLSCAISVHTATVFLSLERGCRDGYPPAARCLFRGELAFRSNDDARQARPAGAPSRRVRAGWRGGASKGTARKGQAVCP